MKLLNVFASGQKLLQIVRKGALLLLGLLKLTLVALQLFFLRLNFSVSMIKLSFSTLNLSQQVRLRLIGSLNKSLLQSLVSFRSFYFFTHGLHFDLKLFDFPLLLLKSISEEQALLDASLGGGWRLSDSLNQSVSNLISFTRVTALTCHVHDSLIKFLLNHLVVSKAFLTHGKLCLNVSISLSGSRLELVVLALEQVHLLLQRLILKLALLDQNQVVLVQVVDA